MAKEEGIRIYLRLRPPATAQHSRILGATTGNSGSSSAALTSSNGTRAVDTTSCDYRVENSFDSAKVHFHVDKRLEDDVVNNTSEDYTFTFRRVFDPAVGQEDVFNVVAKDCVASVLEGYNSTIFAYGQTGSGKTYSITGGTESYNDRGIIPRALGMIYEEIGRRNECSWSVSIAYLQIYNDRGQDLLNHGQDAKTLEDLPVVTVHDIDDETTILRNLEQHAAPTLTDALNLLFLGDTNRLYCETPMNRTSSRSHCVFTVNLEARVLGSSVVRKSKLNLVDLAGSERVSKSGVAGTILTEAKHINLSLHYLQHVIVALSEQAKGKRDHVPFRNSFMTMVLRDSLGGNCRTSMLATAHLAKAMLPETISTCGFAQRVASIRQHAHVNEEVDPLLLVAKLKMEVAQLKDRCAFYQQQHDGSADPDRALTEEEKLVCRGLVDTYVHMTDPPQERIEGFQGDLARIYYCFQIMKDMVLASGGGLGHGAAAASEAGKAMSDLSPSSASAAETMKLQYERQIEQLQVSLQQRENEVNTMFELVSKAQGVARFNASTQTRSGLDDEEGNGPPFGVEAVRREQVMHSGARASPAAAAATTVSGALARVTALTESGKITSAEATAAEEFLRRKAALAAGHVDGEGREAGLRASPTTTTTAGAAGEAASGYNLAALSDAALVEDRAAAFEAFKQSYKHYAEVEATKADLKGQYDTCKETATQLNNTVDTIKAIKTQVQRLRAERAVEGVETADPQESALMQQLAQQREQYNALAAALRAQKETIDGMHAFMKRSQDQLTRDFEAWFAARRKQVALALNGGRSTAAAVAAPTTSAAPSEETVSAPTKPTAPPQHVAASVVADASMFAKEGEWRSLGSAPVLSPALPLATLGIDNRNASGQGVRDGGDGRLPLEQVTAPLADRHPSSAPSMSVSARLDTQSNAGSAAPLQNRLFQVPLSRTADGWMAPGPRDSPRVDVQKGGGVSLSAAPPTGSSVTASPLPLAGLKNAYLSSASPSSAAALLPSSALSARNHHLQPMPRTPTPQPPQEGQQPTRTQGISLTAGEPDTASSPLLPAPSPSLAIPAAAAVPVDTRNPFAPEHRSTGNVAADEQLAALYKLREAMRSQLR